MRLRELAIGSPTGKMLCMGISAFTAWTLFSRAVVGDPVEVLDVWLSGHEYWSGFGLSQHQALTLTFIGLCMALCYLLGRCVVRPILARNWSAVLFLGGLAILDVRLFAATLALIGVLLLVTTLRVRAAGTSLAFVPVWMRLLYAVLFGALVWVLCGLTVEARTYPALVWTWANAQASPQWLLGFWVPDVVAVVCAALASAAAYVVGGYFFNYLTKHWIGPVSLALFVFAFAPERVAELVLLHPQFLTWPLLGVAVVWAGHRIWHRDRNQSGSSGERVDTAAFEARGAASIAPPNGPFCLEPMDAVNPDSPNFGFAMLHRGSKG